MLKQEETDYKATTIITLIMIFILIFLSVMSEKRAYEEGRERGYREGLMDGKVEMAEYVDSLVDTVQLNSVKVRRSDNVVTFDWKTSTKFQN